MPGRAELGRSEGAQNVARAADGAPADTALAIGMTFDAELGGELAEVELGRGLIGVRVRGRRGRIGTGRGVAALARSRPAATESVDPLTKGDRVIALLSGRRALGWVGAGLALPACLVGSVHHRRR